MTLILPYEVPNKWKYMLLSMLQQQYFICQRFQSWLTPLKKLSDLQEENFKTKAVKKERKVD